MWCGTASAAAADACCCCFFVLRLAGCASLGAVCKTVCFQNRPAAAGPAASSPTGLDPLLCHQDLSAVVGGAAGAATAACLGASSSAASVCISLAIARVPVNLTHAARVVGVCRVCVGARRPACVGARLLQRLWARDSVRVLNTRRLRVSPACICPVSHVCVNVTCCAPPYFLPSLPEPSAPRPVAPDTHRCHCSTSAPSLNARSLSAMTRPPSCLLARAWRLRPAAHRTAARRQQPAGRAWWG